MADDNLEQKAGGTFADDLGVEVEYAEVADLSPDQFDRYVSSVAGELNPDLESAQEAVYEELPEGEENTMGFTEYLGYLGNVANQNGMGIKCVAEKVGQVVARIEELQKAVSSIMSALGVLLENQGLENPFQSDTCEDEGCYDDLFGDVDLDSYTPKKKGTPGRPAKEAPKTAIPPKKGKVKKTSTKKKPSKNKTVAPKKTTKKKNKR